MLRIEPEDLDLSRCPFAVALEDLHRGRLASAVRAEQRKALTVLDNEIDVANR
jgi:hypothetical protein